MVARMTRNRMFRQVAILGIVGALATSAIPPVAKTMLGFAIGAVLRLVVIVAILIMAKTDDKLQERNP